MRIAFIFLIMLIFMVYLGQIVATTPPKLTLVLTIGGLLSILTVMNLEWGLYILLFVIPFTVQIQLSRHIEVGTDDVLLLFLIFSWLANRAHTKENVLVSTPLNWPFFIFFISGVISLIPLSSKFSQQNFMVGAMHLLKFFEYVFIYFIVVSCIKEIPQVKKFTIAFLINVGIVALIQIMQRVIEHPLMESVVANPLIGRVTYIKDSAVTYGMSTFGSNAIVGAFYCFALSIAVGLIMVTPSTATKRLLTTFSVIVSYVLFDTYSRSSYVGIVASIFMIAAVTKKRFYILLLFLLITSPILLRHTVFERIVGTVQAVNPAIELDYSAQIRLTLWGKALEIFQENPIFGVGYWGVRYILKTEAHSQYLAYLTEMGIVGLGVFLWLMARMLKVALWVRNNAPDYFLKGLGLGYAAGLVALLTTCFFIETLEAFRMLGPLWFMTGLIVSARHIISGQTEAAKG